MQYQSNGEPFPPENSAYLCPDGWEMDNEHNQCRIPNPSQLNCGTIHSNDPTYKSFLSPTFADPIASVKKSGSNQYINKGLIPTDFLKGNVYLDFTKMSKEDVKKWLQKYQVHWDGIT